MLPPFELKNYKFTKAFHGYAVEEVEEHMKYVTEKYTELYERNEELEQRLRAALARLDAIGRNEEDTKQALIEAEQIKAKTREEAQKQAKTLMRLTRGVCEDLIRDATEKASAAGERLRVMQEQENAFRDGLIEAYKARLAALGAPADEENPVPADPEQIGKKIVEGIKEKASGTLDDDPFEGLDSLTNEIPDDILRQVYPDGAAPV